MNRLPVTCARAALAVILVGGGLSGCATTGSPAQVIEKAQITAEDLYVAIASALNAYEAANPGGVAKAEAIKMQAWTLLVKANQAAHIGQDLTPFIAQLQGLLTAAKAL